MNSAAVAPILAASCCTPLLAHDSAEGRVEAVTSSPNGGDRLWLKPSALSPTLEDWPVPYSASPSRTPGRAGFGTALKPHSKGKGWQ